MGGDEAQDKEFAEEARNSARALIRAVDNKGLLTDGRYASKHIAVAEYNAAKDVLGKLDQFFAGNYSGPGGPGAKVMKQLFVEITTIPTGLEGPWLSPAWQL